MKNCLCFQRMLTNLKKCLRFSKKCSDIENCLCFQENVHKCDELFIFSKKCLQFQKNVYNSEKMFLKFQKYSQNQSIFHKKWFGNLKINAFPKEVQILRNVLYLKNIHVFEKYSKR